MARSPGPATRWRVRRRRLCQRRALPDPLLRPDGVLGSVCVTEKHQDGEGGGSHSRVGCPPSALAGFSVAAGEGGGGVGLHIPPGGGWALGLVKILLCFPFRIGS